MRILLVNQSSGHLFLPIAAALVRRGHRVMLLAGSIDGPMEHGSRSGPGELHWLKGVAYRRETAGQRLLTWGLFSLQLAVVLLRRRHQVDRVLLVSNPPTTALLARWLLPRYALLLYDLYPQVLRDLGLLHPGGWPYRLLNRAMAGAIGRAERVIVLSDAMRQEVLRGCATAQLPPPPNLQVVAPWADGQIFRPGAAGTGAPAPDSGPFVVLYGGNIGLTHPIDPLLAAVDLLAATRPIRLDLVAGGARLASLRGRWQGHGAIRFLPLEPPEEHASRLQSVQLSAVCLEPDASGASLPSKTFAALACGTPLLVIASRHSALVQIVRDHGCGIWAEPHDQEGLVRQLADLSLDSARLQELRSRALAASEVFSSGRAEDLVDNWLAQP